MLMGMVKNAYPVSPITLSNKAKNLDGSNQPRFQIENITLVKPPLLKIFYWESLDIEKLVKLSTINNISQNTFVSTSLNKKLLTESTLDIEHHLEIPTRQLYSKPMKIVFWLRSLSNVEFTMRIKRIQNCQCTPQETRVGFNQFRNLYKCPHRRLINISQEMFAIRPGELVAMSIVAYYHILGAFILSYEIRVSDFRIIMLHFHVNITTFDPVGCVLTTKMIPVNIKEYRCFSQPLWIQNITMQNLQLLFSGKNRGFRLNNPNMTIPRQSVWPLIVEYRPNDFENNLDLYLNYGEKINKYNLGMRYKISLTCKGQIVEEIEDYHVPLLDYECVDSLYIVYPNRLIFQTEINAETTLMVAVHNYDQKCRAFKWQTYIINDYFRFIFEPTQFTLKPHHSKLCVVQAKTFGKPLHFKRIPAVLEVHRVLDKSTQIAQQLLTEVESIDDPKWSEDSYLDHVLLQIDLKVMFPKLQRIEINDQHETNHQHLNCTNIFEKLFWEYLSKSNYMRNTGKIPRNLSYEQVINKEKKTRKKDQYAIDKQGTFNILSFLVGEACCDLSKNYRFIPQDVLDTI